MSQTILLVDDDSDFRQELKESLSEYRVMEASSGEDAIRLLKRPNEIDLVILDVMMPGVSGTDVLREMKKISPELGIIILTGFSSKDVAIEALKGRADNYLEKPIDIEKTKVVIEELLADKRGESDLQGVDLKGKIKRVMNFIERNCYKKTTLNDAALAVCLSPKYLSRVFRRETGKGFEDYKLGVKIEKSKQLLKKTGFNINSIGDKLGYENTESFIRIFKKITGVTPAVYRKNLDHKKRSKKKKRA